MEFCLNLKITTVNYNYNLPGLELRYLTVRGRKVHYRTSSGFKIKNDTKKIS
jgi:hypothetical protein